ncbi:hypothetical protein BG003_010441 [Podila horticola]|nr:hypothetical protein BG003_010441 [Podila horticola]
MATVRQIQVLKMITVIQDGGDGQWSSYATAFKSDGFSMGIGSNSGQGSSDLGFDGTIQSPKSKTTRGLVQVSRNRQRKRVFLRRTNMRTNGQGPERRCWLGLSSPKLARSTSVVESNPAAMEYCTWM